MKLYLEKGKKLKGLSKIIYIFAKIGKILVTFSGLCLIPLMLILPMIIQNFKVNDKEIIFYNQKIVYEIDDDNNTLLILNDNTTEKVDINGVNIREFINTYNSHSKTIIILWVELGFIFVITNCLLIIFFLHNLEKLFKNINELDTPFTLDNVKYIKNIAILLILMIFVPYILGSILELLIKQNFGISFDIIKIIYALAILSLSYIFEYGYNIEQGKIIEE